MRFSENRLLAWIVFAAVVLFSLSFSGGGALKDLRAGTEDVFYHGVMNDGLCIDKDLSARAECAYNLGSTARGYGVDERLTGAAIDSSDALGAAKDISSKYAANQKAQRAVEDLYTAVGAANMSAQDAAFCYEQYKEFISRGDTISRDPYNDRAKDFNNTLKGFPAGLVASISRVEPLELFA